jgi:hypothetical protein
MGHFRCGVVTIYALKVGVAADRDDRDQSLSAFLAERYLIHEMFLPDYSSLTRNRELCSRRYGRTGLPLGAIETARSVCGVASRRTPEEGATFSNRVFVRSTRRTVQS